MRRCFLLIAAASFGSSLLLFTSHQKVQAQPRSGSDTIRFMAAVRGNNYDGTGLKWCVSQSWHESYAPGPASNPYPAGPHDSLDEVSQYGTPYYDPLGNPNCRSNLGDPVDLTTNGTTNSGPNCTTSTPCPSLTVKGIGGVYTRSCTFIEADVYDAGTESGDWKGKLRILHAVANSSPWASVIHVAWSNWYFESVAVGTIISEDPVDCYTTGLHAHQDFMLPTQSDYSCQATYPDTSFALHSTDWQKENPEHYIYSLVHSYAVACVVPGPDAADFLLGPGGALDDTGAGTRSLSTGQTIITSSTCFAGTTWCGTLTVTQPLLLVANRWYRDNVKYAPPPSTSGAHAEWYNDGSYFFQVYYQELAPPPYATYCGVQAPGGTPVYFIYTSSSVTFIECGASFGNWAFPGPAMVISTVQSAFSKFRGANGACPSCPPTQQDANVWAQTQIDGGHWADVVKPALDAVIRPAQNPKDMNTLWITPNLGNSFDGRRW